MHGTVFHRSIVNYPTNLNNWAPFDCMYPLAQNLNVVLRQDLNSLKYTFQQLHTDKMSDINKLCHYWFWLHTKLEETIIYIYIFYQYNIYWHESRKHALLSS